RFETRSSLTNDVIAGAASAAVFCREGFCYEPRRNPRVSGCWRGLAVGFSPPFVGDFTTVGTKGKVQYLCVFLMLGTTFQQPEKTLNTCLRKVHQRSCAIA